jgi:aromatic ring-opening dioxygenase LigB subunit
MPLVKAAILPHSPLLIPEIGRANHEFLSQTVAAYQKIQEQLIELNPETVLILTPHGPAGDHDFNLNIAPELEINFQDFGFIPPKTVLSGDLLLADQIKNHLRGKFSVQLSSEALLDYGSAIPAHLLKSNELKFKLLTITPPEETNLKECYDFGRELKTVIESSDKKIAVISSGDLSHRLKKKSPGGYSPKGTKFDNKLIEYLNNPQTAAENILKMDTKLIIDAGECGLKPIMILLGLLDKISLEAKTLAYQTDFGVGYLSLDFKTITNSDYDKPSA